jgi:sarcosine oxidase
MGFARCCTTLSLGGIRQQFSTPENILLSQFGLDLLARLRQEFGPEADVGFKEQGYLILASDAGREILESNVAIQRGMGAATVLLEPQEIAQRFAWISCEGIAAGSFGTCREGWLDPYALMSLLRKAAQAAGAEWINDEVIGIGRQGDVVTGVKLASGEEIGCGALVNAAGASAGAVAAMAGITLPVEPRKRSVFVFDCREASEAMYRGPLTVDVSGAYVRPEGRQFICGISPDEANEPEVVDWEVDYPVFEEMIWPVLAARIPMFEAIKVSNAWVGHYDYNALDQNGIIGVHPQIGNFYFGNGFSGHGLQQGPATGNAIAELITAGAFKTIDLTRFGYERIAGNQPLKEVNVI